MEIHKGTLDLFIGTDVLEDWIHPLSEITEVDGEPYMNNYATASFVINTIRDPSDTHDNGKSAELLFQKLVLASGQNIPVVALLERVKIGHLISIQRAANAIAEGVSSIAAQ